MMNPDLHRYLDGDLPRDALPPDVAADADEWARLIEAARVDAASAPAWLEQRVMAAVADEAPASGWRRLWAALVEPRTVRIRPVSAVLAAGAAAVLLAVWPWGVPDPTAPAVPADATGAAPVRAAETAADHADRIYVQFEFEAPEARSVAVAGDFTQWSASEYTLRDADGDGVWTAMIPLEPGVHKYMFVVDGDEWVTDPHAERYVDDGFGMRNAVVAVVPPVSRAT